ncbi:hypothetical protein JB92DRAFT_2835342 [Gautieria morchelliformis]|nr:hypothetical protein JB92DRAFT_2835342 [Gautieria morchelliformis]
MRCDAQAGVSQGEGVPGTGYPAASSGRLVGRGARRRLYGDALGVPGPPGDMRELIGVPGMRGRAESALYMIPLVWWSRRSGPGVPVRTTGIRASDGAQRRKTSAGGWMNMADRMPTKGTDDNVELTLMTVLETMQLQSPLTPVRSWVVCQN